MVFMNSLQKRTDEDRVVTAQVSIGESNGLWRVIWNEPADDGEMRQTQWFEGSSWSEMMKTFRGEVLQKMAEGYAPMLDGVADELQSISGRAEMIQKLYYYSDLHKRDEVYEKLRVWRRTQAGKENKAPYMVATNRLLALLSTFLPQTADELMQLPGFGQFKANLYGKEIMAITATADREHSFPLDWVPERIDSVQYKLWIHHQQLAFEERERQRKGQRIAVLEGARSGMKLEQLEQVNVPRREAINLLEELDKDGYDIDAVIHAELSTVPEEQQKQALAAFEQVGDRYLKPIVRSLFGEEGLKGKESERAYEWLRLLRIRFRREKESKAAAKAG